MPNTGSRAGFAQKTKPRRFIAEISLIDNFQCHGAVQIDVERFVSDPHRAATQLDWFSVFARHQFIMLKALQRLCWCRLGRFHERRLAGLRSVSYSLAKHAHRTEFHCSKEFIAAARADALGLHFHASNVFWRRVESVLRPLV